MPMASGHIARSFFLKIYSCPPLLAENMAQAWATPWWLDLVCHIYHQGGGLATSGNSTAAASAIAENLL